MFDGRSSLLVFLVLQCPVLVAWGDKDPWEPIELGRGYRDFSVVEDFIVLPDVGHCPQVVFMSSSKMWLDIFCRILIFWLKLLFFLLTMKDEAPHLVNPLIQKFVGCHSSVNETPSMKTTWCVIRLVHISKIVYLINTPCLILKVNMIKKIASKFWS